MTFRKLNVRDLNLFDLDFGAPIRARVADIGRSLGSSSIGLMVQTVQPGRQSSRRHRHIFQEEILVVMEGNGTLLHGEERIPVNPGDCVCYLAGDTEAHSFENSGERDLVIWAFGNRFPHEVCIYPDHGVAFVEGLGAEVPLDQAVPSEWTEDRRRR